MKHSTHRAPLTLAAVPAVPHFLLERIQHQGRVRLHLRGRLSRWSSFRLRGLLQKPLSTRIEVLSATRRSLRAVIRLGCISAGRAIGLPQASMRPRSSRPFRRGGGSLPDQHRLRPAWRVPISASAARKTASARRIGCRCFGASCTLLPPHGSEPGVGLPQGQLRRRASFSAQVICCWADSVDSVVPLPVLAAHRKRCGLRRFVLLRPSCPRATTDRGCPPARVVARRCGCARRSRKPFNEAGRVS